MSQVPPSSHGGSSSILLASLTLNDAGIRALSTTPAILVPATTIINYDPAIVPDVVFFPIAATVMTRIVTAYTLGGVNPQLLIAYSSDWANDASAKAAATNGFGNIGAWQTDLPCPVSIAPGAPDANVGIGSQAINGDWLDNALVLALGDANLTGGNPANTLIARVLYVAVPTT